MANCVLCGEEFKTKSKSALYCVDCKYELQKERSRASMRKKRERTLNPTSSYNKDIKTVLKELDEYNKEHGTHLTYGQYVQKMGGKQ